MKKYRRYGLKCISIIMREKIMDLQRIDTENEAQEFRALTERLVGEKNGLDIELPYESPSVAPWSIFTSLVGIPVLLRLTRGVYFLCQRWKSENFMITSQCNEEMLRCSSLLRNRGCSGCFLQKALDVRNRLHSKTSRALCRLPKKHWRALSGNENYHVRRSCSPKIHKTYGL